ncbi:MAG: hypothetical protein OER92_10800 [Alphaproteobacteria bacterium]|nr:hypothetical protein [Alphaproteobacteria bacterium]
MSIYADSTYPVRTDLAAIHASQMAQLGAPGTWGTGAQRHAIATAARQACYDAGQLEAPADPGVVSDLALPKIALKVVERLAVSPKDVDQTFFEEALAGGLSDAEYVEIVGLVARVTNFDIFARGIGVPLRPLPAVQPGKPSRERPAVAVTELAWVPTIPNPPEGGELAETLYGPNPKPYIIRALSLVPSELRAHLELEQVQYLPLGRILEYDFQHHEGLTRAQVEIVAGRVSALNECFY